MQTSRISPSVSARFGLAGVSASTRVILPLKGVECAFSVSAGLVEVQMTQIFRQENPQPLDCEYLFPLPADASVFSCEADINGRIIKARVRERAEAVKLAAEKKEEGRRVALVEAERENLFTLTLNNVQPEDLVLITLKYVQPLRALADMPSIEIPFCPGIRYIPGKPLLRSNRGKGVVDDTNEVPDASRISPVRIGADHPDAAFVEIRGTLDAHFIDAASLVSPSHQIISSREGSNLAVRLSEKSEVPDRDFVLRWKELLPRELAARAWLCERDAQAYALLEIRAPQASGKPQPMDFYFLADRSGSMQGVKWEKAALAVQSSIQSLADGDRAMLTLFSDQFNDFAERPLPPGKLLTDPNFRNLAQLPPDGGTQLGPALRHVLEVANAHSRGQARSLILITDAQVGNEDGILKLMQGAPDFTVHCFGVDVNLNDALLVALARQQRGTFHSLNPGDDVARAVTDLARAVGHPVLTDLRLPDAWEPSEALLPPLYSGQVCYLSARAKAPAEALGLSARRGKAAPAPITVATQASSSDAPYLHWCKHRIERHIREDQPKEAIALSVQSNLVCTLTAFIAWDEAEKVPVARQSLAQPALGELKILSVASLCASPGMGGMAMKSPAPRFLFRARAPKRELFAGGSGAGAASGSARFGASGVQYLITSCHDALPVRGLDALRRRWETLRTADRRLLVEPILAAIGDLPSHPEWKPLCSRILAWASADPTERERQANQLQRLVSKLLKLVAVLDTLRQRMRAVVGELRASPGMAGAGLDELERALDEATLDVRNLAERWARFQALPSLSREKRIGKALAKAARLEAAMGRRLTAFAARAPSPSAAAA
ncbi:MAG TPA: VIT and VWA domain-containing protein [Candidatus Acidoferrum sp.]|nr:VIT and VWA domain-containing protein [Candidatus Acidoferrum sp.]